MKRITITAFASCNLQDVEDLEANALPHAHTVSLKAGDVKTFNVSERSYDTRIRPQLISLSQMRIQANDGLLPASRTRPSITYTVEDVPGQRARITQVNAASLSVGAPAPLVLTGINLIPGLKGSASVGTGVGLLTATAVRKGPSNIRVVINPGAAATSVVTTVSDTGAVVITVTPTVAQSAVLIAAQINGDVLASRFVLASSGGAGTVTATTMILTGGDDAGVAIRYFPSVLPLTSFLLFEAHRPGNDGNTIAIRVLAPGAAAVAVVGNLITVTPAAGFIDMVSIAAQLNGSAPAAALGVATAVGAANLSPSVFGYVYLYGGAGESATASIGGAAAAITVNTDTSVTLTVGAAALLAAGVLASEHAVINILTGYQRLQAQIPTVA
jgi:hypothetical protein